jgi:amino acid transporter
MGIIITIAIIVLVAILGIIALRVFKNSFKAFSLLFFTVLFLAIIMVFFFIQDLKVFQDQFSQNKTVYLLDDDGELRAGFALQGLNITTFEPVQSTDLESYIQDESDQIRIVVKRSSLGATLQSNQTGGYSLGQAIDSPDYQVRATGFMIGVLALVREESLFHLAKLVREEKIAIYPQSFAVRVLTFDSKEYKDELQEQYTDKKELVFDSLGVRTPQEVNGS